MARVINRDITGRVIDITQVVIDMDDHPIIIKEAQRIAALLTTEKEVKTA